MNKELLVFTIVVLMLVFAPLFNAGNLPLPIMILEVLGLLLLALLVLAEDKTKIAPWYIWGFSIFILIIPWLYLIPVSEVVWESLPYRTHYQQTFELFMNKSADYRLSLIAWETTGTALTVIPPVALFLAMLYLPVNRLIVLSYVFLVIIGIEAIIGMSHYLLMGETLPAWLASFLNFKEVGEAYKGDAHGTYVNRDHFSALMAMGVAICFASIAMVLRQARYKGLSVIKFSLLVIVFLLVIIAMIFSRSRAGVGLGLLSIFMSSIIFSLYLKKEGISKRLVYGLPGIALLISFGIGIIPTINRFIGLDPTEDGRVEIFENTIIGIKAFFPLGSGPGTFDEIYRNFQPIDQLKFIDHAHNDYLELFFETGLVGMFLVGVFLLLYLFQVFTVYINRKSSNVPEFQYLQAAAGVSTFVFLLHGLVDFNFHIPANALFFAFMLGILFHQGKLDEGKVSNKRRSPVVDKYDISVKNKKLNEADGSSWRNKRNPFQDQD